jgi:hypothetical protein
LREWREARAATFAKLGEGVSAAIVTGDARKELMKPSVAITPSTSVGVSVVCIAS